MLSLFSFIRDTIYLFEIGREALFRGDVPDGDGSVITSCGQLMIVKWVERELVDLCGRAILRVVIGDQRCIFRDVPNTLERDNAHAI